MKCLINSPRNASQGARTSGVLCFRVPVELRIDARNGIDLMQITLFATPEVC